MEESYIEGIGVSDGVTAIYGFIHKKSVLRRNCVKRFSNEKV